jgi:AraC-like DNA-binding protein
MSCKKRTSQLGRWGYDPRRVTEYLERAVRPELASRFVCTWVDPPREQRHGVLPDACIDLVWDGAEVFVAGPDTRPVPITGASTFVGIRFRPGSAPGFLGVPASELVDRRVPLVELWGRSADVLAECLADEPATAARVLEETLLERQALAVPIDPLVEQLLCELGRHRPRPTTVRSLAGRFGVDERTLRRRSLSALGYGPKTLDRILRFRRVLRLFRSRVALAEAAWRAGYVDQAHLSHECRRLSGATPSELLSGQGFGLSSNGGR